MSGFCSLLLNPRPAMSGAFLGKGILFQLLKKIFYHKPYFLCVRCRSSYVAQEPGDNFPSIVLLLCQVVGLSSQSRLPTRVTHDVEHSVVEHDAATFGPPHSPSTKGILQWLRHERSRFSKGHAPQQYTINGMVSKFQFLHLVPHNLEYC